MREYQETLRRLAEQARREGCGAEEQVPLAPLTSFRVGGPLRMPLYGSGAGTGTADSPAMQ